MPTHRRTTNQRSHIPIDVVSTFQTIAFGTFVRQLIPTSGEPYADIDRRSMCRDAAPGPMRLLTRRSTPTGIGCARISGRPTTTGELRGVVLRVAIGGMIGEAGGPRSGGTRREWAMQATSAAKPAAMLRRSCWNDSKGVSSKACRIRSCPSRCSDAAAPMQLLG